MKNKGWLMRCAKGCGTVVHDKLAKSAEQLEKTCDARGFVKIGKLYYCPRCAAKKQAEA